MDVNPTLVKLRLQSSREDLVSPALWRGVVGEFVATLLFVFVGCGSALDGTVVSIGLCFGLAIGTLVWIFCDVSGGHINPAVSLAMLLTRRISLVRAILYILVQCLGGIAGAAIIRDCVAKVPDGFCVNGIATGMSSGQGVVVELLATTVLILTIFAACDTARTIGGSAPLSIGLAVAVCHFAFIPVSGASMNPARSLGPAIMADDFKNLWVYWVGPLIASVLAGFSYEFVFSANASLQKIHDFILEAQYNPEMPMDGVPRPVGVDNPSFTNVQSRNGSTTIESDRV